MKAKILTLILIVAAFFCGLAWNSKASLPSLPVTYGYVPYESSPGTFSPTQMLYNNGSELKTFDMFRSLYYFGDNGAYFFGTGSPREINAENDRLAFGDVQGNANETLFTLRDSNHTITLKADVVLPELPNCAKLGTDSTGKIICSLQLQPLIALKEKH